MRALSLTILNFFLRCPHLIAATAIHRMHFSPQTQRGTGTVKGGKPSPNDDHLVALFHRDWLALNLITQIGNSIDHALSIFSRDSQIITGPTADSQIDGIKAL